MKSILRAHHPKKTIKSFGYAFSGVFHTLLNEANFRIQLLFVLAVIFFGAKFQIELIEWAVLITSLSVLLSAEMINTVVEHFIDVLIKEYHEGAGVIKDISSGFVLISGVSTLLITILIFSEEIIQLFI